jgi:hypothetical protein
MRFLALLRDIWLAYWLGTKKMTPEETEEEKELQPFSM